MSYNLLLLLLIAPDGVASRSQARLPVDKSVLKTFAQESIKNYIIFYLIPLLQGPNEMLLNYDGRVRAMEKSEHHSMIHRMPKKRGAIIDGKLIPYSKLNN